MTDKPLTLGKRRGRETDLIDPDTQKTGKETRMIEGELMGEGAARSARIAQTPLSLSHAVAPSALASCLPV